MSDSYFVDTNVLVYAHDRGSGPKYQAAKELVTKLWHERSGVLSTQVLQEFYVNLRRKAVHPVGATAAKRLIEDYLSWNVVVNDSAAVLQAVDIERRYKISFWDALIIQAANAANVSILYTEDLNHGQTYGVVEACNPFA
jgi:predicted nucleic acid-binding protein